jgi:hypothetical protein
LNRGATRPVNTMSNCSLLMATAMAIAMFTTSSVASNLPKSTLAANPHVLGRAKLGATRFPRWS